MPDLDHETAARQRLAPRRAAQAAARTGPRPAYRKPWTHGAKAYDEADTLDALRDGLKRARNSRIVYVAAAEVAHLPCAHCGIALGDPYPVNPGRPRTVQDGVRSGMLRGTYFPRTKVFVPHHYYCGWGALMADVIRLGRAIQLG